MDCNSYSYMSMSGDAETIAAYLDGNIVYLEACINFFGDRTFYVHEILGDFAEEYPMTTEGYREAARAYNSLVPETDCIPEF